MSTYLVTIRRSQQTVYEVEADSVAEAVSHYKDTGVVVGEAPLAIDTLTVIDKDRDEPLFAL